MTHAYRESVKRAARKRQAAMQALRDKGWTLQRIGDKHKIGRERVRQILNRASAHEGI